MVVEREEWVIFMFIAQWRRLAREHVDTARAADAANSAGRAIELAADRPGQTLPTGQRNVPVTHCVAKRLPLELSGARIYLGLNEFDAVNFEFSRSSHGDGQNWRFRAFEELRPSRTVSA